MQQKFFAILVGSLFILCGCSSRSPEFEMTVEKVDELKGFILKGIAISGPVTRGCIANDATYVIKRKGKKVFEDRAQILLAVKDGISREFNGETIKGDVASLYIRDGKLDDVQIGDVLSSDTKSCENSVDTK